MKKYRFVLFDLDGTLTDPKEGICKSVQYALYKMNIEEPDLDKLEPFIGPTLSDSFQTFYGLGEKEAETAIAFYRERFSVTGIYENKLYEGIPQLLKRLRDDGCRLAVASGKPQVFVERILKYFKIDKYFDVVVGSELDGRRSKKEEIITEALNRLYAIKGENTGAVKDRKKDAVMVGDRSFDMEGAGAVGIDRIGVDYGYAAKHELRKSGADYIVKSVSELSAILCGEPQKTGKKENKFSPNNVMQTYVPATSVGRAIYMLTPFLMYEMIIMAVALLFSAMFQPVTEQGQAGWINDQPAVFVVTRSLLAASFAGLILLFCYRRKTPLKCRKSRNLFFAAGSGCLLALGLNLFIGYICEWIQVPASLYQSVAVQDLIPVGMGIVYYVTVSPLVEELVFRWLVYGRIKNVLGVKLAVPVSAFFFGIYHGNLIQGIYAFIMGCIMALIYEWTDNFLTPVIFHVAANGIIYMTAYLPEHVRTILSAFPMAMVMLITGGAMVWYLFEKNIRTHGTNAVK